MSVTLSEELVSFREAARLLPRTRNGRSVHVTTLHRWSSHGLRGQRLETLKVGGSTVTSREALQRFFDRLTALDAPRQKGESPSV